MSATETLVVKVSPDRHIDAGSQLPKSTLERFSRANIDLTTGYPEWPESTPFYLDEAINVRGEPWHHIERASNADPDKKALLSAASEVIDLTPYIGTEIVGLQLKDLTPKQLDELALLIAERVVVFFRDQDLSPQKQLEIGKYFGKVEVHPKTGHVPGLPGTTIISKAAYLGDKKISRFQFRQPNGGSSWHTDLVHEIQPAGITHLHNDAIPKVGGDTLWATGYGAYDKLSPYLQQFLDGKKAVYRSAHTYVDRQDPLSAQKHIEREHYLVRTHPATGWKSLFVNRAMTTRIVGLEPKESAAILELLFRVYEDNLDLQVRFKWKQSLKPGYGTSALWDNRISQHYAIFDYGFGGSEGKDPNIVRHGTRVTSLAERPYFDPESKSQRQALNIGNN